MKDYQIFLQGKIERSAPTGFEVAQTNPHFFPYQALVSEWGLRKGNYLGALAVGMGKCVAEGTLVPTEQGLVPIEKLKPSGSGYGQSSLQVKVQTPEGVQETAYFYDSGINPTRKIQTRMGFEVAGTFHHPILTLNKNGQKEWKDLQNINSGDFVAIQRHSSIFGSEIALPKSEYVRKGDYSLTDRQWAANILAENDDVLSGLALKKIRNKLGRNVSFDTVVKWRETPTTEHQNINNPNLPEILTPDFSYILGVLVGDGSLRGAPSSIILTSADKKIVDYFYRWVATLGLKVKKRTDIDYVLHSVECKRWLKILGLSSDLAHEKKTPWIIMRTTSDNVRAYLSGLFDTDGSALNNGSVEFCSSSKQLAKQTHLLLLQFGIVGRLRYKSNEKRGAWHIQMFGAEAAKFYERVGFTLERKQNRRKLLSAMRNTNIDLIPYLPKSIANGERRSFREYLKGRCRPSYQKMKEIVSVCPELEYLSWPPFFWDEVVSSEDNGLKQTYDLCVPESHSFVANGIVSHNTILQVEDAKQKQAHYGGKVLFVAPLAVSHQTILEAKRFNDIDIVYAQSQAEADLSGSAFIITNQEHIIRKKFDNHAYNILVLDEASKMLKAFRGKARNELTYQWGPVPHKTAWTATPAPNQLIEILNYAEFLGIKSTQNALTKWFDNDASKKGTEALYLKPLMEKDFWEWLASWCVVAREPADLGFSNVGHELPEVEFIYETCKTNHKRAFKQTVKINKEWSQRRLIPETNHSATNMWADKRATVTERAQKLAEVVEIKPNENWFILTDTDYERDEVNRLLDDCTIVTGSQTQQVKEERLLGFARGEIPRLLTKPGIAGFGLNFQYHCNNMALVGLTHKWEIIHQVIGRIVRPLQTKKCYVHFILADSEVDILAVIDRKQKGYGVLQAKMTPAMKVSGVLAAVVERNDNLRDTPHNEQMLLPAWLKNQERTKEYA